MEFGATYPYENIAPIRLSANELKKFKGKFGEPIKGHSFDEILDCLPIYAQTDENEFPLWKKSYIKANREFYLKNKKWLDNGLKEQIQEFENSHQKLEWNCGKSKNTKLNLMDKIIQFRPLKHCQLKYFDLICVLLHLPDHIYYIFYKDYLSTDR